MIDESLQIQLREQYSPEGSDLRKVQLSLLDILVETDRVCREHGIQYWLDSGTVLGAVRHGGFIPWDDDLDICIRRRDYRRFCRCMRESLREPYRLLDIDSVRGYNHKWPRIVNENVKVTRSMPDGTVREENIWMDVFLMCNGHPSYVRKLDMFYGRCFRRRYGIIDDGWVKRVIGTLLYPVATLIVAASRVYGRIFHSDMYVHDFASGFYSMRRVSSIFPLSTLHFEGWEFMTPADPDAYLTLIYGDYMRVPPEDKRESHNILKIEL